MARIEPIPIPPAGDVRELLEKTLPDPDGAFLNVFTTLAHQPRLLRRINSLGAYFLVNGSIDPRERELVILRVAARTACDYELGHHLRLGVESGLGPDELTAVADLTQDLHDWADRDRALLGAADELTAADTVSDDLWNRLGRYFDQDQLMDLLVLVGYYRLLAGVLNGLQVSLDRSASLSVDRYLPGRARRPAGEED